MSNDIMLAEFPVDPGLTLAEQEYAEKVFSLPEKFSKTADGHSIAPSYGRELAISILGENSNIQTVDQLGDWINVIHASGYKIVKVKND